MKNFFKTFVLLLVAFLNPLVVHAEDRTRNANFFLTVGRTYVEYENDKENTGSIKFGTGYRISDYAGFEFYYIYYGQISERTDPGITNTLKSDAFVFNVIGILPVSKSFDIYAKVGVSAWNWKADFPGIGNQSEDGTDAIYSLGIGYNVDYDSTVRLEYELSEYDILDYSVISFGFQHNF